MDRVTLRVRAKINLSLGIRGVDDRGYHDLDMLLCSVKDIYDEITVYDSSEIVVTMDGKVVDEKNTAYKALKIIEDNFGFTMSADIKKGIPFSAGLGGSSCDAAGVFCGCAKLHKLDSATVLPYADMVGSDVAFMMRGGSAISRGQGSDLTFVELPSLEVIVMKAKGGSDTGAIFRESDKMDSRVKVNNELLIEKIRQGKEFASLMQNALYLPASGLNPEISTLYDRAKKVTDYVVMSGSGSSIVAVVLSDREREQLLSIAEDAEYYKLTNTVAFGVEKV